ncbi:MAG: hypothetical protein ABRQ37_18470 [Candidatus Eremiobacterota bacterium]
MEISRTNNMHTASKGGQVTAKKSSDTEPKDRVDLLNEQVSKGTLSEDIAARIKELKSQVQEEKAFGKPTCYAPAREKDIKPTCYAPAKLPKPTCYAPARDIKPTCYAPMSTEERIFPKPLCYLA